MITSIDERAPRVLQGRDRVYHHESRQWGWVAGVRVSSRRWPVLVHFDSGQERTHGASDLLYVPNGFGPGYPCLVREYTHDESDRVYVGCQNPACRHQYFISRPPDKHRVCSQCGHRWVEA